MSKKKEKVSLKKEKKINKVKLLKSLKKELWELCKIYIRKKYPHNCYTCSAKNISGGNMQTGHFIPSLQCPFELDYHPNNLRLQCMRCNKWSGGYGAQFYRQLFFDHGHEYIQDLFIMRDLPKIITPTIEDYQNYIAKYKQLIKDLK